jgi:hypothetical protein
MDWEETREGIRIRESPREERSITLVRKKLQGGLCPALRIQASIADIRAFSARGAPKLSPAFRKGQFRSMVHEQQAKSPRVRIR